MTDKKIANIGMYISIAGAVISMSNWAYWGMHKSGDETENEKKRKIIGKAGIVISAVGVVIIGVGATKNLTKAKTGA